MHIYIYNIYVIMKTMCPPSYHDNGFMTTYGLVHMMYDCVRCTDDTLCVLDHL